MSNSFCLSQVHGCFLFYYRLSVSNDLKVDAERDLTDIGANKIPVFALNKVKSYLDIKKKI